jgi:hypothetical protein
MAERLERGEAIDLSDCPRTPEGHYIMADFREGADYCDAKRECWMWSIGRNVITGEIRATTSGEFYQNEEWVCLWLR